MLGNFGIGYQEFVKSEIPSISFSDADPFFREVTSVKTKEDIAASQIASRFSDFAMKELIDRIENIIDIQKVERHDQVARKIESILDNNDKMNAFCLKNQGKNIDTGYLEFGYPIMVQSGGVYNLKMGASC